MESGQLTMIHAVRSGAARLRIAAARELLASLHPADEVLLVGASRGAVDDLARQLTISRGVSFGVHRFSITQLAARVGWIGLAGRARTPMSPLAHRALVARAAFDAVAGNTLGYLAPVRGTPGFARALAATLSELRLHGMSPAHLAAMPRSGPDLADLLDRIESLLETTGASDRAALFDTAIARLETCRDFAGMPVLLFDVPFESPIEQRFLLSVARRAPRALFTLLAGDVAAAQAMVSAGVAIVDRSDDGDSDLGRLQTMLFSDEPPAPRPRSGELFWLSAPGEARESVEIARRMLQEAARGVRFDEMAVLLRSPGQYAGLLEHALDRAGIPAWFDRGTRRPDPAGRALLALLDCAIENLSATRFAEYLSLAQVPIGRGAPADALDLPPVQDDDVLPRAESGELPGSAQAVDVDVDAARLEAVRPAAPWKWERLLVESAVVGGRDRWARRLRGLAQEYRARMRGLEDDDPDDARIERLQRELENLSHLEAFALPIVDEMSAWPARATWGEWLAHLDPFVRRVLRQPTRVLQVLAALHPMAEVGPVSLVEVRDVIVDRLHSLEEPAAPHRYGKVFIAAPDEARGRAFRVVFVPGLAERLFPRPLREDPLLVDELRRDTALLQHDGRAARERLLLRLCAGAATERLYVSFPRVDANEGRARVPSFYALELMRAVTGHVPDHQVLAQEAADTSGAALAWPAPVDASLAIDDFEHDLSVLRRLMAEPSKSRGRAQYLLQLNPHLRRSLTSQWHRARHAWTPADGIVRATEPVRAFLATQRLGARPYSVSALQHYAACPYRFLLAAIYRLAPLEAPVPLQRMDPLTRGSLFHRIQAEFFRALETASLLPLREADRSRILRLLDDAIARAAAEYAEKLAPALERVWRDEVAALATDLHVWVDDLLHDRTWEPWRFEFAFGLPRDDGHDAHSLADPVTIDGRFTLRGSIDLVERRTGADVLRVTDHKTSRNRSARASVLGGGTMLQPVLYSLAVEAATGLVAEAGRFSYCTSAGGFTDHVIPITDRTRRAGLEVLEIIDRAIELGTFPAAPADRACTYCDFRPVCGPDQERRVVRKSTDPLGDLFELRKRP
jgi:CRISPR/Cas system-associated exonuclease Cas4 (RecB family)